MDKSILFSFITLFFWGFWGFFPKLATKNISPMSGMVYEIIGVVIVGVVVLFMVNFQPEVNTKGIVYSILTGLFGTIGTIFFFYAFSTGKTTSVILTTAMYPVITLFLAFVILREPITLKQGIGMIFSLIALILIN